MVILLLNRFRSNSWILGKYLTNLDEPESDVSISKSKIKYLTLQRSLNVTCSIEKHFKWICDRDEIPSILISAESVILPKRSQKYLKKIKINK